MDGQHENSIPPTNTVCRDIIKVLQDLHEIKGFKGSPSGACRITNMTMILSNDIIINIIFSAHILKSVLKLFFNAP